MSETLRELIALDRDYFVPAQVAEVLGMDAQAIRILGRRSPERLPFPVIVSGSRVKIPKIPFLKYMGVDVSALTSLSVPQNGEVSQNENEP